MSLKSTILLLIMALQIRASGVEFSVAHVAGKRLTVCRVDLRKERLQLFLRDDTGQPIKRFDRLSTLLEARGRSSPLR
jgi:uncharacterized protein YigE (DUF2233 family)